MNCCQTSIVGSKYTYLLWQQTEEGKLNALYWRKVRAITKQNQHGFWESETESKSTNSNTELSNGWFCSKRKRFRRCFLALLTIGIMIPFYWMCEVLNFIIGHLTETASDELRQNHRLPINIVLCLITGSRISISKKQKQPKTDDLNKAEMNQKINP
jgi:hypothetical protein